MTLARLTHNSINMFTKTGLTQRKNTHLMAFALPLLACFLVFYCKSAADGTSPGNVPEATCSVDAFLLDHSESGIMSFRFPANSAVKRLPSLKDSDYETGVYIKIRTAKNGWVQIESISRPDGSEDSTFRGLWISGKMAGVQVADYDPNGKGKPLRSSPSSSAAIEAYASPVSVVPVIDCKGGWIYTETLNIDNKQVKGWLAPEDQCANMVSNCS